MAKNKKFVEEKRQADGLITNLYRDFRKIEERLNNLESNEGSAVDPITLFFPVGNDSDTNMGDFAIRRIAVGADARVTFIVPDNFGTLVSLEIEVRRPLDSGSLQYDLNSDYHNPDNNEDFDFHSQSALNQTIAVTVNKPELISLVSVFTSLAAGDFAGIRITNDGIAGAGNLDVTGVRLIYTPA